MLENVRGPKGRKKGYDADSVENAHVSRTLFNPWLSETLEEPRQAGSANH